MDLINAAGKAALGVVKNEGIQSKAASALGMLFPYVGIKKRALDMYLTEIEKSDMPVEVKVIATLCAKDTLKRLKNQKDIADIAMANAKEGTNFDASSGVSQEWFERFMDSAGVVSDEEVQLMWGKILANEFEEPGSTPHNMIRILSEITPKYAKAFQTICSMRRYLALIDGDGNVVDLIEEIFVPFKGNENEMEELGLSFVVLNELETLGLIKLSTVAGYAYKSFEGNQAVCTYVDGKTKEYEDQDGNAISAGNVILTDAGQCLSKITESIPIANYEELENKFVNGSLVKYKEKTDYEMVDDGEGGLRLNKRTE